MAEEAIVETVEVAEKVEAPEVPKLPEPAELKEKGWSAAEIESGQKRGMVAKPEEKKEAPKAEVKAVPDPEVKTVDQPSIEEIEAKVKAGVELTPDEERGFLKKHPTGTPDSAFYHRAKNERRSRQRAERELEAERSERAREKAAFEARLAALEGKKAPEEGDEDPDNKPLTVADLKRLREEEAKAIEEKHRNNTERAKRVTAAQVEQEEFVRSVIPDFDDTVKLAAEVMQNLDAMLPEKWQQARALKLIRDLQVAAANADQMDPDDFNAAHIAYEIGKLHPKWGKPSDKEDKPGAKTDPKANGGRTPEEMERMKRNAQQRPSSASVPQGGAKRSVTAEEVTAEDLNRMTASERLKFREKHPERYTAIVRG